MYEASSAMMMVICLISGLGQLGADFADRVRDRSTSTITSLMGYKELIPRTVGSDDRGGKSRTDKMHLFFFFTIPD
jgi:hypothetical protein